MFEVAGPAEWSSLNEALLPTLPELLADVAHVTNDFCRDVIHKVHVQTKFT